MEKSKLQLEFQLLADHVTQLRLSADDMNLLPALKHPSNLYSSGQSDVRRSSCDSKRKCSFSLIFVGVVVFLLLLASVSVPTIGRRLARLWLDVDSDSALKSEQCLVEAEGLLIEVLRPPVDCAICRGVIGVDEVVQLTSEEFEARYAYSGRPVVVRDAAANWSALNVFSFQFFQQIFLNTSHHDPDTRRQFFPYQTEFRSLHEALSMEPGRAEMQSGYKPWYIGWSNYDSSVANVLRSHYARPYFLPVTSESSNTDWIFMGSPTYGAPLHIDNVEKPSWQAQIKGSKLWTIQPPPECYFECGSDRLHVTVEPGNIIVLDTNQWYHSTLITGSQLSITIGSEFD